MKLVDSEYGVCVCVVTFYSDSWLHLVLFERALPVKQPHPLLIYNIYNMPPPQIHFPSATFPLLHPSNLPFQIPKTSLLLKVPTQYTKPEIKNYLQQLYQFKIKEVKTVKVQTGKMGMDLRNRTTTRRSRAKMAIVDLEGAGDTTWPGKKCWQWRS